MFVESYSEDALMAATVQQLWSSSLMHDVQSLMTTEATFMMSLALLIQIMILHLLGMEKTLKVVNSGSRIIRGRGVEGYVYWMKDILSQPWGMCGLTVLRVYATV
jgi:hypothetical protein